MQETTNFADSPKKTASITITTILPPNCEDQNIPSDKEHFDYQQDSLFEPDGEMEVVAICSSDDE